MTRGFVAAAIAFTAGFAGSNVQAQDWTGKATIYAWLPSLDATVGTEFGDIQASQGSSDVISSLDMAFMGTFAAQKDRLGFVVDYVYADLTASEPTPFGKLFSKAAATTGNNSYHALIC